MTPRGSYYAENTPVKLSRGTEFAFQASEIFPQGTTLFHTSYCSRSILCKQANVLQRRVFPCSFIAIFYQHYLLKAGRKKCCESSGCPMRYKIVLRSLGLDLCRIYFYVPCLRKNSLLWSFPFGFAFSYGCDNV